MSELSRKKPRKPYPSFPLTAHTSGQWCKKIRGKVHFFGVWADPQAALEKYLKVAADLHSGRQPLPGTVSPEDISVKDLCNRYWDSPGTSYPPGEDQMSADGMVQETQEASGRGRGGRPLPEASAVAQAPQGAIIGPPGKNPSPGRASLWGSATGTS